MHWEFFFLFLPFFLLLWSFNVQIYFFHVPWFVPSTLTCPYGHHLSLRPIEILWQLTIDSLQLFHIKFTFFFLLSLSFKLFLTFFVQLRTTRTRSKRKRTNSFLLRVDLYTYLNLREKFQSRTADDEKDDRLVYLLVVKPCAIFQSF